MYSDGVVVGRIMKAMAAPVGEPWLWTLAFVHHEDRTPTHGTRRRARKPRRHPRGAGGENNVKANEDGQPLSGHPARGRLRMRPIGLLPVSSCMRPRRQ